MSILAVKNVSFGSNYKKDESIVQDRKIIGKPEISEPSNLKKVPVALMIAMLPNVTTTDTNINEQIIPIVKTEVQKEAETNEIPENTYVYGVDEAQQSNPYPWRNWGIWSQGTEKLRMDRPATANNVPARLLYSSRLVNENKNIIDYVYIVKEKDYVPTSSIYDPPKVITFVYHNIGPRDKFCSAILRGDRFTADGKYAGIGTQEVRLDDNTAQRIINLLSGDSKNWVNGTNIGYIERHSSYMQPSQIAK